MRYEIRIKTGLCILRHTSGLVIQENADPMRSGDELF